MLRRVPISPQLFQTLYFLLTTCWTPSREAILKREFWGRPRGLVVGCTRSAAGSPGLDPGHAPTHRFSGHAEATSHIQQLEGCATMTYNYLLGLGGKKKGGGLVIDVSSEPVFLRKKRISMDVSLGLIFLTKNT